MPQQPDYDALARRFNGAQAVDYDALAQQVQTPQPAVQPPQPEQPGAVSRLFGNWARTVLPSTTPSDYITGPLYAARHPIDSLKLILESVGGATADQARQTVQAGKEGRTSEMAGHGLATALPLIGPAAAAAGEQISSGDIAGGIGTALGLLMPFGRLKGGRVAGKVEAATQGVRGKLADAAGRGVERRIVDVMAPKTGPNKTRFGNQAAKIAPKIAREPELGAVSREGLQGKVEQRFAGAKDALDTVSDERSDVRTFETKPVLEKLKAEQGKLVAEPVEGSRPIPYVAEAAPDHSIGAPERFASPGAKDNALFAAVKEEAARTGYTGSPKELRAEFDKRLQQAKSLRDETVSSEADYGPTALLAEIRRRGGLRPYTRDLQGNKMRGDLRSIVESFGANSTRGQKGGASIFRNKGLWSDDLAQQLSEDPKWSPLIQSENDLLEVLDEISRNPATEVSGDIEHYLRAAGVEPGTQWWKGDQPPPKDVLVGRPIGRPVVPEAQKTAHETYAGMIRDLERLGPVARYESLRKMRAGFDEGAKAQYTPAIAQDAFKNQAVGRAYAKGAGTLRDFLAEKEPATAKANADYHLFKTASDVMRAAEEAERVRPNMFRKTMGRVTGAATGTAAGGAVGAVAGILTADFMDALARSGMTTKVYTARLLATLEDALRGNRTAQVQSLLAKLQRVSTTVGKTSTAAGRTQTANAR